MKVEILPQLSERNRIGESHITCYGDNITTQKMAYQLRIPKTKELCEKLNIELSHLTSKTDINLQNTISEILDDKLFEDLDILSPEVKDLVSTNPKIGKAIVRLGDILKKKDHEMIFIRLDTEFPLVFYFVGIFYSKFLYFIYA